MAQCFYVQNGQQSGPVEFEQLRALASTGQLRADDLVWTEGMADWQPAGSVPAIFTTTVSDQVVAPAEPSALPVSPASGHTVLGYETAISYLPEEIKPVSYLLWLALMGLTGISMITFVVVAIVADRPGLSSNDAEAPLWVVFSIGVLLGMGAIRYSLVILYRAWQLVPPNFARTTPARAVGFLFIPFLNFYWIFQAYYGLSVDYGRTTGHDWRAPQLSVALFLTQCILCVMGAVPMCGIIFAPCGVFFILAALAVQLVTTYQMCSAINCVHRQIIAADTSRHAQ